MSPIPCPCCRATNTAGPACRRCKANLDQLVALEARRDFLIVMSSRLAADGEFKAALAAIEEAASLRDSENVTKFRAVLLLLTRDFSAAWGCHRAAGGG